MRWFVLAALAAVTLFVLVAVVPLDSSVKAISERVPVTALDNYDIRTDKSESTVQALGAMRGTSRALERPDDTRFKIEYNDELDVAEVISPAEAESSLARRGSGQSRATALKNFVANNQAVFGVSDIDQMRLTADYKNPDGDLSFVRFEQKVNDIPVFGAEVKAGFSRRGELFRVVNSLAHNIDERSLTTDFGEPELAVERAAAAVNVAIDVADLARNVSTPKGESRFSSSLFGDEIIAERRYFPLGSGVVRPAWQVLLWTSEAAYYVVVDAADGTLLWRKNIVEHQTLPATYSVYGNQNSLMKTADSPSLLPSFSQPCSSPIGCPQPPAAARTTFTLVGNQAPYAFNNLGWIPDTGLPVRTPADPNITDGNNVETGIDRDGTQGVDNNGWAFGNPSRVFNFNYNPGPGLPPPGEEPLPTTQIYPPSAFQQGAITHGFYVVNRWHDEMYRFGFTEQAGNFQHFNFGRGGSEGDRISFETQDGSGTNGANFATPTDGGRPRMQMFVWTGPTPDRDGALDSQVVVHELTHGLSNRLIGNATGLSSNMSRGMGEGWSDFYALALLSRANDNSHGTYTVGGYISYLITPGYESNYYYGIRRFPVAIWASRGENGLPHNPLTFRYMNNTCNTLIGSTTTNPNSAFPRGLVGSATCDQVHNLGEIWAVTLWEVRYQLSQRHGDVEGNRRILQYVTDGMKLSPLNPTFLQERDAILAAVAASDAGDVANVWRGFAIRGLGFSASIQNAGTGANNTAVTEAFDVPPQFRRPTRADFDGDGRSDISVFRPADRIWYLNRSTAGFGAAYWGLSTDVPVPDDFDGDGKADVAVFRATDDGSQPDYYVLNSATSTITYASWGITGDIPLSEDFDGDNRADLCIYRPSNGQFWIRRSSDGGGFAVGPLDGTPFVGDFDGDGRGDFGALNRFDGLWRSLFSGSNYSVVSNSFFGNVFGDKPVPADYDGDGRDDPAVYRPSSGTWLIRNSSGGTTTVNFGISTDIPVPADYDGDSRSDVAIYRNGTWWINNSTSGISVTIFGLAGDRPLPATYIP
ncbi:MAG: M36 family metallopeptidase [Pyrinomonadaceae bacterium]